MKDIPCAGLDYIPWLAECWVYYKLSSVSELQIDVNVDHYRPARCSTSKGRPTGHFMRSVWTNCSVSYKHSIMMFYIND